MSESLEGRLVKGISLISIAWAESLGNWLLQRIQFNTEDWGSWQEIVGGLVKNPIRPIKKYGSSSYREMKFLDQLKWNEAKVTSDIEINSRVDLPISC